MNDYEHRCFWDSDGWRIDGQWRILDVVDDDDYWLKSSNSNKITIGPTRLLGITAINIVPQSPYGPEYNFIKTNG